MKLSRILLFFFLLIAIHSNAQTKNDGCDKVYEKVDQLAVYRNGMSDVLTFITSDLATVINRCVYDKENLPSKLLVILTIDKSGGVIDAIFPKNEIAVSCQYQLKQRLLKMKGWKAAIKDGKSVCSKFTLPIACLKWAE